MIRSISTPNEDIIFLGRKQGLELLANRMPLWHTGVSGIDDVLQDAETVVRGITLRLPALGLHLNDRLSTSTGSLKWTPSVN